MPEYIKMRIIKNLIDEIRCLSATDLELVGHKVVSMIESKRLIHHGINKDYKPVGHTVDSFSPDSTIVAEYSTEKTYFESSGPKKNPSYEKIEKDLTHALAHNKPNGPSSIYLISNQEEPPSFRDKFDSTPLAKSVKGKVVFFDAHELAKIIYEQSILNSSCASFYTQFLPNYLHDLNNYEYYGKIPSQCEHYVPSVNILKSLKTHYHNGHKICVLHGLSGAGKTQAAIEYVHHEETNFDNYIWIAGEDWKKDTPLSAVKRSRGGTPVNVAGIFNAGKTILVIDSIERKLELAMFNELADGFTKGGVVLATSQLSTPSKDFYLPIPSLSKSVAFEILGEDPDTASDVCKKFVSACLSSPLILATARNILSEQGIKGDVFYKEVLDEPEDVRGDDGGSIIRKIISKLNQREHKALSDIANSGLGTHDLDFLRNFIGINACSNLQRLSIVLPANTPGVVKVHDLVCLAMQDDVNASVLAEAIEKYVEEHEGEMEFGVLRQIHLAKKQIHEENLRRGERQPDWLTYALLQIEREEDQTIYKQIYTNEVTPDMGLASMVSIIDSKEIYSYSIENLEEQREYYQACAQKYGTCFAATKDEQVKAELLHHRGKALRRCGQYEEALKCFNQLFEIKPNWHATYGQIAHLGSLSRVTRAIKAEGEKALGELMERVLRDPLAVPLRVSLAAISRLRSYKNIADSIKENSAKVQILSDIIAMSALDGFDQFYESFVAFTSLFRYNHGKRCVDLAEALPEMLAMPPSLVDKRQWVNACDALANMAITADKEGKQSLSSEFIRASCAFADAISEKTVLTAFNARAVAKAYNQADKPKSALAAIEKVPDGGADHWLLYVKSKTLSTLEKHEEALQSAVKALNLAVEDLKGKEWISIYHERLSSCREALGDIPAALNECSLAIDNCNNDKYKETLKERLEMMKPSS
ncbi:tetratricopeptide repeat protein [Desulfovibrio inopinatus]|uniref:tetratricopeptide repeat protein n=1 Tax=Desulfovibrio inopinatus TaxID=102109 RepID=UPI0004113719|nr:tetratricopeptide repeat protein [Desulfovibrio inopinatus]